jgi:iron complex transport system substrate-binding protein
MVTKAAAKGTQGLTQAIGDGVMKVDAGSAGARATRRHVLVTGLMLAGVLAGAAAQAPPSRIVSLVPAATEMLFAIGAGPRVVGVSSYDHEPPEVDRLTRVGALLDPDLERILSLRPDLVVVYGTQHELREQLSRAGIPMAPYTHGTQGGLREVTSTIRMLGDRTGTSAKAGEVAAAIERQLAGIRRKVAGRPRPRTLLIFGREPGTLRNLYASGGHGFLHDMLDIAGGENVFAGQKRESVQVSAEVLLTAAPEMIVEIAVGGAEPDPRAWRAVPSLPAVRSGRIVVLSGTDLVTAGPRVATATERIARVLHPDAF